MLEFEINHKLKGCWRNLQRRIHSADSDMDFQGKIDKVNEWAEFFLVAVNLMPTIRTFNAADPHCIPLVDANFKVLQGRRRRGPMIDAPLPGIYNAATWHCGSDGQTVVASDVSCVLQCENGYKPILGITYCRNIGGAGTEYTHLMTVEGLPGVASPLDSAQCCVANAEAQGLTQFSVATNGTFMWTHDQGFGHVCGHNPLVHLQACRVPTSMNNLNQEAFCADVCSGRQLSQVAGVTCNTQEAVSLAHPDWETWRNGPQPSICGGDVNCGDANFTTMNSIATNEFKAGDHIGSVPIPVADPSVKSIVLYRMIFDGNAFSRARSIVGSWTRSTTDPATPAAALMAAPATPATIKTISLAKTAPTAM